MYGNVIRFYWCTPAKQFWTYIIKNLAIKIWLKTKKCSGFKFENQFKFNRQLSIIYFIYSAFNRWITRISAVISVLCNYEYNIDITFKILINPKCCNNYTANSRFCLYNIPILSSYNIIYIVMKLTGETR